MSKTVAQKAKEWKCSPSTVRSFCASGIIPMAEKIKGSWELPDDLQKPPLTRFKLCFLLDTIEQLHNGATFEMLNFGMTNQVRDEGFKYLAEWGFVSKIDLSDLKNSLVKAIITPRGVALVDSENANTKGKLRFKVNVATKFNVGIASIEAGGELSNG